VTQIGIPVIHRALTTEEEHAARAAGRRVFEELTPYPLPSLRNTQDYVFYFVGEGDAYGRGARRFFKRFYKKHREFRVTTLQELVSRLHGEITSKGVQHIREVVIVAHGTDRGLILPVVNGVTDTANQEYRYLTAASLALLQHDTEQGRFAEFEAQRQAVVSRLGEGSWITFRACNFGKNRAGLAAFFAFFGGRANVYAPKMLQFFGTHPILPGMRLESRLEVHGHLVKQGFFPKDLHTEERKDAVVRALAEPARFSDPIDLLASDLSKPNDPETTAYEAVVRGLNRERLPRRLRTELQAKGITLSSKRKVRVVVRGARWIIRDVLVHAGKRHSVEYTIDQRVEQTTATLAVEARIPDLHAANEFVPIQLFFDEAENRLWRGWIFTLASHTNDPDEDPTRRERFRAVYELLNAGGVAGQPPGSVSLIDLFAEEGIPLSPDASISLVSSAGIGVDERRVWRIDGEENYLLRLEHPLTSSGHIAHAIGVYEAPDRAEQLKREYELMAFLGKDPDHPGTELMASLDRRSIDDLAHLVEYLRNPYRPEHAVFIHHALEAIKRKREFPLWYASLPEVQANQSNPDPLFPITFPLTNLSLQEREDKSAHVYDFEPDVYWAEVRASNPPKPFTSDLFREHRLELTPLEADAPTHLEPDSPYTDLEELREVTKQGLEPFFQAEKYVIEEQIDPEDVSCAQFQAFIEALKDLQGLSAEEIEAALEDITIIGDLSLFKFKVVPKPLLHLLNLWTATGIEPGIAETVVAKLVERIPALGLGTFRLTSFAVHVTRAMPYVGIVTMIGEMFWNYLKEHSNTLERWEQVGKLTAIRRYARELRAMAHLRKEDFPETIDIQVGSDVIAEYFREQLDEYGTFSPFVFAPERMQKGFNEALLLVEAEAREMLSRTDRIIDQALVDAGLDSCKIRVLREQGIIDPARARALVMGQYARLLLDRLPKI